MGKYKIGQETEQMGGETAEDTELNRAEPFMTGRPEEPSEEEADPIRLRAHKLKFGFSLLCGFIALICGAVLIFMSFQIQNVLMKGVVSQGQNSDQILMFGIKVGALAAVLILMLVIQIVLKAVRI